MTCLPAYMYRQIPKCTDKTPKKHYWGGGGELPPPPPGYASGGGEPFLLLSIMYIGHQGECVGGGLLPEFREKAMANSGKNNGKFGRNGKIWAKAMRKLGKRRHIFRAKIIAFARNFPLLFT